MNFFSASDIGDGLQVVAGKLLAKLGFGLQFNPTTKAIEVDTAALPAPANPVKRMLLRVRPGGVGAWNQVTTVLYDDTGFPAPDFIISNNQLESSGFIPSSEISKVIFFVRISGQFKDTFWSRIFSTGGNGYFQIYAFDSTNHAPLDWIGSGYENAEIEILYVP